MTILMCNCVLFCKGFVYFPLCMDIHQEGNLIATGCKGFDSTGCEVKIIDIRNPSSFIREYKGHTHDVTGVRFSSYEDLYSVSKDGSIYVRNHTLEEKEVLANYLSGKNITSLDLINNNSNNNSSSNNSNNNSDKQEFVIGSTDGSISILSYDKKYKPNEIIVEFSTTEYFTAGQNDNDM